MVNRRDEFLGILPINALLVSDPTLMVRDVMRTETEVLSPLAPLMKWPDVSTHGPGQRPGRG